MMGVEQCIDTLNEMRVECFVDLEFEPHDHSVFDYQIESPFDVVIHWRRPGEMMRADF